MDHRHVNETIALTQAPSMWKLIRKLRWIGLEDEARQLQLEMRGESAERNCGMITETFNTD